MKYTVAALVLALLGAFGYGWLARGQSGDEGQPLWLTYDSLAQTQAPTLVTAHLSGVEGEELRLWLDQRFLDAAQIERIQPEPAESTLADGRVVYRFAAEPGTREATVHFHYTPTRAGKLAARIGIVDGHSADATTVMTALM